MGRSGGAGGGCAPSSRGALRRCCELAALDAHGCGNDVAVADPGSAAHCGTQPLAAQASRDSGLSAGIPQRLGTGGDTPRVGLHNAGNFTPDRLEAGNGDRARPRRGLARFAVESNNLAHVPSDSAALSRRLASGLGLPGLRLDRGMRLRAELLAADAGLLVIGTQLHRDGSRVWAGVGRSL